MPRWRNWARAVECAPRQIRTPATEEELAALIAGASGDALPLRAVGSGHSYALRRLFGETPA
jgi:FAD/FMN-containing dehydrogenase